VLTATFVSAHGFLRTLTINGQAYIGNIPLGADNPSVIRQVDSPSPNKGASNPALTCGPNSTAAANVASANPGDPLTFSWKGADLSNWPHNTGPMLTYLANCGSVPCNQFDITTARWFKIAQVGRASPGGPWVQADLMAGGVAKASLPSTLAPGNYLLRHEIIALHLATSLGGAEFYPACSQIQVGGSQTGGPKPDELVSIPGAYNDNDSGIFDPNVFDPNAPYTFPGPAIAAFVGASASSDGGSSTTDNPPTTTTAGSAPPAQTTKSKTCRIKKASNATSDIVIRPRHFSRTMRRLLLGDSHRF